MYNYNIMVEGVQVQTKQKLIWSGSMVLAQQEGVMALLGGFGSTTKAREEGVWPGNEQGKMCLGGMMLVKTRQWVFGHRLCGQAGHGQGG